MKLYNKIKTNIKCIFDIKLVSNTLISNTSHYILKSHLVTCFRIYFCAVLGLVRVSMVAQMVKNLPAIQETQV